MKCQEPRKKIIKHEIKRVCYLISITSATKKRATTSEDLIRLCCIHDFLTAIRSAKWFPADRMPMNNSTPKLGSGGARHLVENSRCCCGEILGCVEGKEAANIEWTSISPCTVSPVASSRVKPCSNYKSKIKKWYKSKFWSAS
jgi:hypothetical protein